VLNILRGFSVGELANAFVSSHAAMEKRIVRAKKVLAGMKKLLGESASCDQVLSSTGGRIA